MSEDPREYSDDELGIEPAPAVVDVEALEFYKQMNEKLRLRLARYLTASVDVESMCNLLNALRLSDGLQKIADDAETLLRQQAEQIAMFERERVAFGAENKRLWEQIAELRTKAQVQYGELIAGDDRRDAERYRRLRIGDRYDFYDHDRNSRMKLLKEGSELDAAIDAAIASHGEKR